MADPSILFHGSPEAWRQILDEAAQERACWSATDRESIWRHQLMAPFQMELSGATDQVAPSLGQILHDPQSPVEWLMKTKDFAKANMRPTQPWMPREIASVLYYASIAAFRIHHHQSLSQLDANQLRRGFSWAAAQSWLDGQTRDLLRAAAEGLDPG
jgi:hypothetical protein